MTNRRKKAIEALSGPNGLLAGRKVTYCQPNTRAAVEAREDVLGACPGKLAGYEYGAVNTSVYCGKDASGRIYAVIVKFPAAPLAMSTAAFVKMTKTAGYVPIRFTFDPVTGISRAVFLYIPVKKEAV